MARVELEKVSKIYPGDVKAVNAIDLDIADREFVVLVGPSAVGKAPRCGWWRGWKRFRMGSCASATGW